MFSAPLNGELYPLYTCTGHNKFALFAINIVIFPSLLVLSIALFLHTLNQEQLGITGCEVFVYIPGNCAVNFFTH